VANRRARDILARHFPGHLGPDLSRNLRTRFEIMLPAEAMRPS
jgi:hypothetical protein